MMARVGCEYRSSVNKQELANVKESKGKARVQNVRLETTDRNKTESEESIATSFKYC